MALEKLQQRGQTTGWRQSWARKWAKGSIVILRHWMLENCTLWQGCKVFDAHFKRKRCTQWHKKCVYPLMSIIGQSLCMPLLMSLFHYTNMVTACSNETISIDEIAIFKQRKLANNNTHWVEILSEKGHCARTHQTQFVLFNLLQHFPFFVWCGIFRHPKIAITWLQVRSYHQSNQRYVYFGSFFISKDQNKSCQNCHSSFTSQNRLSMIFLFVLR